MAEAEIRGELEQVRAALEMMRAEQEVLRDRDNRVANKLSEIEANYAYRLTTLEIAYIARDREQGHHVGGAKLRTRDAEKFMPEAWTGEKGACPFSDLAYEVENYLSVLDPSGSGKALLEWAAGHKEQITPTDVADIDLDERFPLAKELNSALGQVLTKVTKDTAKTMVKRAGPGNGLRAWQNLARWYRLRSAMDKATSITMVMNPGQSKDMGELHRKLEEWEVSVREHESRFDDEVQESVRIAALLSMIPRTVYDQRFKGRSYETYLDLRQEIANYLSDRRPTIQIKQSAQETTPMDIGEMGEMDPIARIQETLNALVKGKGKGRSAPQGEKQGSAPPSSKGGVKGDARSTKGGGKGAKGARKELVCYNCGGNGHPARLCPTPQGQGLNKMGERLRREARRKRRSRQRRSLRCSCARCPTPTSRASSTC